MNRGKVLEKAFQRGHLLNLKSSLYSDWIKKFIVDETKGDIGKKGDITTDAVLRNNRIADAVVKTKEDGVLAGIEEATYLYKSFNVKVDQLKKDGSFVKKGEVILKLKGREKDLLKVERSALDIISRMSGIATLTNDLIKKTEKKVGIAPTRKTQWRYLDKKAVYLGGGLTHRSALWDSILIKDNHLELIKNECSGNNVEEAIERAWKHKKKSRFIEIEVQNEKDALIAAKKFKELKIKTGSFPCLVMLDNINPNGIKKIIKSLKKEKLYGYVLLEASGGIDPGNIVSYANSGVDVVSLGYLTHSVHSLDVTQIIK